MTIRESLGWEVGVLNEADVEGPESSAVFLLRQLLKVDRAYLYTHSDDTLTPQQLKKYKRWVSERKKYMPVWYITGVIEFMGLDLAVNRNVLIPRPETELLLVSILEHVRSGFKPKSALDIGTGSGAIACSVAHELKIKVCASDVSKDALSVTKKNVKTLGLEEFVEIRLGDLFALWIGHKFDLITANLPYIPHEDMSTLAPDIIHYEPRLALDGGEGGLEIYERFFKNVNQFLAPGGKVFCEIGYDQGEKIKNMLSEYMPNANVIVLGDYNSIDRVVIIET